MNKKYWYKVFESTSEGTRTLATCNSLPEAKRTRKKLIKSGGWPAKTLKIDKWVMDRTGTPLPMLINGTETTI